MAQRTWCLYRNMVVLWRVLFWFVMFAGQLVRILCRWIYQWQYVLTQHARFFLRNLVFMAQIDCPKNIKSIDFILNKIRRPRWYLSGTNPSLVTKPLYWRFCSDITFILHKQDWSCGAIWNRVMFSRAIHWLLRIFRNMHSDVRTVLNTYSYMPKAWRLEELLEIPFFKSRFRLTMNPPPPMCTTNFVP